MLNRLFKFLTLAYLVYLAVFPLVLVPLANHQLGRIYQQETGRQLQIDHIDINPFSLKFSLYKAVDRDSSGASLWGLDELTINLSLCSLLGKGLVLDELRVKALYVQPEKHADGRWSFDDILAFRTELAKNQPAEVKPVDTEPAAALPAITIHRIDFNARHLGYSDLARSEPFEFALENTSFWVDEFSTVQEGGKPLHLTAHIQSGGELEWVGNLSLPGKSSEGNFQLRSISLLPAWHYIQSDVNFKMHSAALDVHGNYKVSWSDAHPQLQIDDGRVVLKNVEISPKEEQQSGMGLEELSINGIRIDSGSRVFHSDRIDILGFRGTVTILENGVNSFAKMLAPANAASAQTKAAAQTEPAQEKPAPASNPWQTSIGVIKIRNALFAFNDYAIAPDFKTSIRDFGGDIGPISTDTATVTKIDLKGKFDGYAPVTIQGKVKPLEKAVDLKLALNLNNIKLQSFDAYARTYAGYKIDAGLLTASFNYTLANHKIIGSNKILIRKLALGERTRNEHSTDFPLQLTVAVLADENNVIDLDVDVSGNTNDPNFNLEEIIVTAFSKVLVNVTRAPLRMLSGITSKGNDMEYIAFESGQALLSDQAKKSLTKLHKALRKRPQLVLGIAGLHNDEDKDVLKKNSLTEKGLKKDLDELSEQRAEAVQTFLVQDLHMDPAAVYLESSVDEQRTAVKLLLAVK